MIDWKIAAEEGRQAAKSLSTRQCYAYWFNRFEQWLQASNIAAIDQECVLKYLSELYHKDLAPTTLNLITCAISYSTTKMGLPDPVSRDVRDAVKGWGRLSSHRGYGQSLGLTKKQYCQIIKTACDRRTFADGRQESVARAEQRGQLDRVIVTLLFMAGMRVSEVAALKWNDVFLDHDQFVFVRVRRSKTNQNGSYEDVRLLKEEGADAMRQLYLSQSVDQLVIGLHCSNIANRFISCCRVVGLKGRYTSHSGRIGLASELSANGASITAIAKAGGWRSHATVIHYARRAELERGAVAKYL